MPQYTPYDYKRVCSITTKYREGGSYVVLKIIDEGSMELSDPAETVLSQLLHTGWELVSVVREGKLPDYLNGTSEFWLQSDFGLLPEGWRGKLS